MTKSSPYITRASTSPKEADDLLVDRARQDPAAFARLYDRYLLNVYRYLFSKVGERSDAEDLTSQVFLAALEAFPRYKHKGYFKAWLLSIARHKAADYYRNRPQEIAIDLTPGLASDRPQPLEQVIQSDELRCLADMIAQLGEEERELLHLRFAAQLSFSEISHVLKRKESAVKMALYRLLERLEVQLEAKDGAQ